jgi:hypothetical protein
LVTAVYYENHIKHKLCGQNVDFLDVKVLCCKGFTALLSVLQMLRIAAMKEERERQYKAGERSKEEHYANAPRIDAY